MSEPTAIQAFYAGKTIFITGGSGLMGKVLVEKLLYTCSDLERIYILLRPKRGRTPNLRVEDMFKLPMFNRIRADRPSVMKKLTAISGDVSMENMGIAEDERKRLLNEVNVVFHCAATLRLEAKLKDAMEMNAFGTASMLQLAKGMKNLEVFVHLSTAFCHVDQEELGERVYDSPNDPHDVMRLVKWLDEKSIDLITPSLLEPHPNTYTYSKRLAETLVANEYPNLPCVIARPSIVTPAWKEPLPGWVDNLNGPVGLIVAGGKGVLRSMHCNGDYHAEVIPVDLAINSLIAIARKVAITTERTKSIPVYNITQSRLLPITWAQILEKGKKVAHEYPFDGMAWFPDGELRSSKFIHNLFVIFFHLLPAYLIDFLMLIFRQKRFMVRIQKRISDGLEVLQYFTTRDWIFHNTSLLILVNEMSPKDKELFPVDFQKIDIVDYIKDVILGARQYCMKEKLETLPRARMQLKILYVVHIITVYSFYFGMGYLVYKNFGAVYACLQFFSKFSFRLIPIIKKLLFASFLERVHW